jgi:hypothetical protein
MHQCKWLLNRIREACKAVWNVAKMCSVDEMMVRYKGKYCPSRQYMPKKPIKWGLKLWCLACAVSKFIYNFDVYCRKSNATGVVPEPSGPRAESNLAEGVVLKMVDGMENKGHVVVMDNYFTGVCLLKKLLDRGIYATGTVRNNRVGLPLQLANTKEFDKNIQGTLDWRMHDSKKVSCVVWKDKKPVLLLSIHAKPIVSEGEEIPRVPRRNGEDRPMIKTSPVHLEYTNDMRGVDVADHIRSNYSCQVRIHKWWHRVFFFLLDLTSTNMYVMYLDLWKKHSTGGRSLTHLQFLNEICKALTQKWPGEEEIGVLELPYAPRIHVPTYTKLRRRCVICKERYHYYCYLCNCQFHCFSKGCWEKKHTPRN